MMRRCLTFSICLAALVLTGCAGYRVGPVGALPNGEKSVQVAPFANQTLEPNLTDAVTTALRRRFQQDGTYKLVTDDNGDIVVTGAIVKFERSQISFQPQDTLTLRDFYINLTAQVTARSRITGQVVFDRTVTGNTIARAGADLPSAERQALPLAAEDLAKKIVSQLAEGTW